MNKSKIEQAIDEIYDYVDSCRPTKLSPSKIVVDREYIYNLLDDLRMCAPDEIKRYQKIINNREGILNEAQQRAEDMLAQAQNQTAQLLDQSEIVQTAYQRAEDIMKQATEEAKSIVNQAEAESAQMRKASLMYTNDLLAEAQQNIESSFKEMDNKTRMLSSAMKNSIQQIRANREELMAQLEPEKYARKVASENGEQQLEVEQNAEEVQSEETLVNTEQQQ